MLFILCELLDCKEAVYFTKRLLPVFKSSLRKWTALSISTLLIFTLLEFNNHRFLLIITGISQTDQRCLKPFGNYFHLL